VKLANKLIIFKNKSIKYKNLMVIENQIPKTETVYELKDEYKVPSFEEFMETYESDEGTENSYYDEFNYYGNIGTPASYGPGEN